MQTLYVYYVVFLACVLVKDTHQQSAPPVPYPIGDVRNCRFECLPGSDCNPTPLDFVTIGVLPGAGFDNLRNIDLRHVHFHNYSSCKLSSDGKYLLPDNVFLFPHHESTIDVFSEFIDHWDKHTSMTAQSINEHAGFFFSPISSRFSQDYMQTKSHMVNDLSTTARVQIRHLLYSVMLAEDSLLHPDFKSRLFEIAAHLQNNNTDLIHYLAELIVRDFGTHYVTSIDAGAIVSQTDHVSSTYTHDNSVTAAASASFFRVFFVAGSLYASLQTDVDTKDYLQNRKHSTFSTHGGPPFQENYTNWVLGVPDALAAIDRSGEPLHFAITPNSLPELPETTVQEVSKIIYNAINRYYKVNTRLGCTNLSSPNFHFQANLDDGSCKPPLTNLSFGGVYQTCTVDPNHSSMNLCKEGPNPAEQDNPLTGDFSCPKYYTPIKLHTGNVTHTTKSSHCKTVCVHCGYFGWKRCCHCQNIQKITVSQATYDAYWCAALPGTTIPPDNGYLFGGVYTSTTSNPFTGSKSCPQFFIPLHIGEDIQVCVSNDYEKGSEHSVPFAGFDSCDVGNPLAADHNSTDFQSSVIWPKMCPHGYAQHLVAVDEGCEINFCVHIGSYTVQTLLPARLPPFRKYPKYKANITDTLVVSGIYGETWMRNEDGTWVKEEYGDDAKTGEELLKKLGDYHPRPGPVPPEPAKDGNSGNVIVASASVVLTILLGAIIMVMVFAAYKQCKASKKRRRQEYTQLINGDQVNPIN